MSSYPNNDHAVDAANSSHQLRPSELFSAARQQVDALAPSLDLSTALLARYPWNHGPNLVKHSSAALLASARASMTRPITDQEATAVIRATRAKVSAEGQAQWLSVVLAGALWVRGIKVCRFPFWTPKKPPFGGGPMTQTMRMVAYSMVCMFAMKPVEQSIGAVSAMSNLSKEDKDTMEGLMKAISEGRRHMQGDQQPHGLAGMAMQGLPPRQQQREQQSSTYTTRWPSDDSAQYSSQSQQQAAGSNTTRWPEDPSTQYNPEQQSQSSNYQTQQISEQQPSDRWGSSSIIDDASPLAPEEPYTASKPAETSWARLRQQARTNNTQQQQQQQPQQQQGSWQQVRQTGAADQNGSGWGEESSGRAGQPRDSYSFSAADVERETAKDQAQKEFDAMLERERRGDGPSRGQGGGWRR